VQSIAKGSDGKLNIKTSTGVIDGADCLIWAVGRAPNADIALDKVVSNWLYVQTDSLESLSC